MNNIKCVLHYFPKYFDKEKFVEISEKLSTVVLGEFSHDSIATKFANSITADDLLEWGFEGNYEDICVKEDNLIMGMREV